MSSSLREPVQVVVVDDHQMVLDGLRRGALSTYASDHCHLRLDRDKVPDPIELISLDLGFRAANCPARQTDQALKVALPATLLSRPRPRFSSPARPVGSRAARPRRQAR